MKLLPPIFHLMLLLLTDKLRISEQIFLVQKTLSFCHVRQFMFPTLAPIAQDLTAAPASQVYVERIFSVCRLLSHGNRNRMSKSLEMRVCLKLNRNVLLQSGFSDY